MTYIEALADERTHAVLSNAVSVAIEKMAEDTARELLKDPDFREELKRLAKQSMRQAMTHLHQPLRKRKK